MTKQTAELILLSILIICIAYTCGSPQSPHYHYHYYDSGSSVLPHKRPMPELP